MINSLFLNEFHHQPAQKVIYCFTNDINSKQYVGLTINFKNRIQKHYICNGNAHFQRAWKKYGWQHFHLSILENVPDKKLSNREVYWIAKLDTYNNGYNSTQGGEYGTPGYEHSEETKKKMSKSNSGKNNAMSGKTPWNKGKTGIYSEQSLRKMSESSKGQIAWNKGKTGIYSEETLQKMKHAKKGYIPWNKGLKGKQIAWNKGLKKSYG